MIQDGNIMRYIPPVPYEEEVRFYEELDENVSDQNDSGNQAENSAQCL